MSDGREALRALKRELSESLLAIAGVSGLGVSPDGGALVVYLAHDEEAVRRAVEERVAGRAAVRFAATGAATAR